MKIAPRQISAFLAKPPGDIAAILLHGNDTGMINERAKGLALLFNDNLDDVFSVTRLTGDMLAGEAGLIADSAAAIPAFGGKRLVLVKGRGTELLEAAKIALQAPLDGTMIIIEASDTTTKHAIVKLFETSKKAASIGCYADSASDLRALASSIFSADRITVHRDALDIIVARLGSDRASSRSEMEKLALMAGPGGNLAADDVRFALGDSALLAIDDIADALASGGVTRLQTALGKAWSEEANAVMILRGCQNYFRQIGLAATAIANGQNSMTAIKSLRPPPHFKLQDRLAQHLRNWRAGAAMDIVNRLQDIELNIKSGGFDERILTAQSLLGICLRAPR